MGFFSIHSAVTGISMCFGIRCCEILAVATIKFGIFCTVTVLTNFYYTSISVIYSVISIKVSDHWPSEVLFNWKEVRFP